MYTKKDLLRSLYYKMQEAQGSSSAQTMGPPTDTGHHTYSPSHHPKKNGLGIIFQGEKIKPQIFKIFVPVSRLLLALASSQEGAPEMGSWGEPRPQD